jgi:osmotically-inducible protein OsmY
MKNHRLIAFILMGIFVAAPICGFAAEGDNRSAGQYIDDNLVAGQVKGIILGDAGLKGFDVTVTVYKGTVQLSGFVDNQAAKDHAGKLAESVKGVTAVENDLIIR